MAEPVNPGSGVPIVQYQGLDATESEIRLALSDPNAKYCEWESAGLTFVLSEKEMVIVRAGAMGGDVRDVHGGWKYFNLQSLYKEWHEITAVEPSYKRRGTNGTGKRKP